MTIYLIKTALVLLFLIVLYLIARKQNGRITILEKDVDYISRTRFNAVYEMIDDIKNTPIKEPSFHDKIKKEEKRISKMMKDSNTNINSTRNKMAQDGNAIELTKSK